MADAAEEVRMGTSLIDSSPADEVRPASEEDVDISLSVRPFLQTAVHDPASGSVRQESG